MFLFLLDKVFTGNLFVEVAVVVENFFVVV